MLDYQKLAKAELPKTCFHCGKSLKFTDSGVDLVCKNSACKGAEFETLVHFFSVVKIDGLGPGELEKMANAGFDTVPKLIQLKSSDLAKLEKFGKIKASKLADGLQKCLKGVKLAQLMDASGLFQDENSGLGSTKLQSIIDKFGKLKLLSPNLVIDSGFLRNISEVKGIGPIGAELFCKKLPKFKKLYAQIENSVSLGDGVYESKKLLGQGFCFTGFRDKNLEDIITKNAGKVTGGITRQTTVLFSAGASTKTTTAQSRGIKVVGSTDAVDYIKRLLK